MLYIEAKNHGPATNFPIVRVVIHGTVSPCRAGQAVLTARMFAATTRDASTQKVHDPTTTVRCVPDNVVAYGAPPNQGSLHHELCDPQAGPGSRWQDADHQAMLQLAAADVADDCRTYGIPVRHLTVAQLKAGEKGICGHADVSAAWHQTDHVDPGPDFPWTQFLGLVNDALNPAPTPTPGKGKPTMLRLIRPGDSPNPIYVTDGMKIRWIQTADQLAYYQGLLTAYGLDATVHTQDAARVAAYGLLDGPDAPNSIIVWN